MFAPPVEYPSGDWDDQYRSYYRRHPSARVSVLEQEQSRSGAWRDTFEETIEIGPDPPMLYKKYIWGRKSEFLYFCFLQYKLL